MRRSKAAGEGACLYMVRGTWERIVDQEVGTESGRKFESAANGLEDFGMGLGGRAAGVDGNHAARVAACDGLICAAHAMEERPILLLKAILIFVSGCFVGGFRAFGLGLIAAASAL